MKVMLADTSAIVRAIFTQNLSNLPDYKIIASVSSCQKLLSQAKSQLPDIIICGNDLSDEDEVSALKILCQEMKIPVIILKSSETAKVQSFSKQTEYILKPGLSEYTPAFFKTLEEKINKLNINTNSKSENLKEDKSYKILCIGASTGGPTAVAEVLNGLGKNFRLPVLYAQHIEIGKDKDMATWLNSVCKNIQVKLAKDGELALPGTVYMAPADTHLVINYIDNSQRPVLKLSDEAPERFLRPAVNKLFKSASEIYKSNTLAVLLTGMGADGANGCKQICDAGGWTIVEDKSTCAVFGMPAAAIEAGGAKEVLPRPEIAKRILELTDK